MNDYDIDPGMIVEHRPDVPFSLMLSVHGLHLFDERRLQYVIDRWKPFEYPEGTLEFPFPNEAAAGLLYTELKISRKCHSLLSFRNLLGFPLRRYTLLFSRDYERRLRERNCGIGLGPGPRFNSRERLLEILQVTIRFPSTPRKRTLACIIQKLSTWFAAVSDGGLESEGPVHPVTPVIELRGHRISMFINASLTGPRTLVWLLLECFGFGHEVALIENVLYNEDDPENVRRNLEGAQSARAVAGLPWTIENEKQFIEEMRGGIGEKTIQLPLVHKGVRFIKRL